MDKLEFDIHDIEYVSGRRPARDINILSDIFGTISASISLVSTKRWCWGALTRRTLFKTLRVHCRHFILCRQSPGKRSLDYSFMSPVAQCAYKIVSLRKKCFVAIRLRDLLSIPISLNLNISTILKQN